MKENAMDEKVKETVAKDNVSEPAKDGGATAANFFEKAVAMLMVYALRDMQGLIAISEMKGGLRLSYPGVMQRIEQILLCWYLVGELKKKASDDLKPVLKYAEDQLGLLWAQIRYDLPPSDLQAITHVLAPEINAVQDAIAKVGREVSTYTSAAPKLQEELNEKLNYWRGLVQSQFAQTPATPSIEIPGKGGQA